MLYYRSALYSTVLCWFRIQSITINTILRFYHQKMANSIRNRQRRFTHSVIFTLQQTNITATLINPPSNQKHPACLIPNQNHFGRDCFSISQSVYRYGNFNLIFGSFAVVVVVYRHCFRLLHSVCRNRWGFTRNKVNRSWWAVLLVFLISGENGV